MAAIYKISMFGCSLTIFPALSPCFGCFFFIEHFMIVPIIHLHSKEVDFTAV